MLKSSAGLLMYRDTHGIIEVLLVHPGGPFWARKDDGAWSIPKGELSPGENALEAAKREFREEIGFSVEGALQPLVPIKQPSGKTVYAWAVRGDIDVARIRSNTFSLEWPRRSGRTEEFPEVDRAGWFTIEDAKRKVLKGQIAFLDQLQSKISE